MNTTYEISSYCGDITKSLSSLSLKAKYESDDAHFSKTNRNNARLNSDGYTYIRDGGAKKISKDSQNILEM